MLNSAAKSIWGRETEVVENGHARKQGLTIPGVDSNSNDSDNSLQIVIVMIRTAAAATTVKTVATETTHIITAAILMPTSPGTPN